MTRLLELKPVKTYATYETAVKKALATYPDSIPANNGLTFLVQRDEATGRYFPIFLGNRAIERQVHFVFCCAN
jgi:hypothetical protein